IIKSVEENIKKIENNLKKWGELKIDFERYFAFKEERFKEGVKKIENIFGENFRNNMNLVEKECYSLLDSIKKIFKYFEEVKRIESKTSEEIKLLKKSGFLFKNLIKDGEILSIYSMIEAKRAFLEDEGISKGLKSLIFDAERNIKEIIEITNSLEKSKLYKAFEIELTDTLKRTENLKEEISHLDEKIEEIFKIRSYLLNFEKKLYEWKENLQSLIDKFSQYEEDIKEEVRLVKERIEEFIKFTQKIKTFEIPQIKEKKKEILKLVLTSDPITFNPYLSQDAISNTIISKIHNTLFVLSPLSTKILPLIVKSFEISGDGLKYKLKLKENVYFHNDKKLTSYEVYESFKKTLKGVYKEFFLMIQGAQDYIKGIRNEIEGIKIINENEMEIYLEYPFAPFISNLTLSSISITYDERGKLYGCGPYVLKEYIKGEKIILERFDKYFYGTPYFDIVEYLINPPERSVESVIEGKIHYLELSPLEIEELKNKFPEYNKFVKKIPTLSIHRLDFNNEREPFNIKEIRKAICYTVSSKEFVEEVLKGNGVPAKSVFPPIYEFYNPEIKGYEKNIQIAKELLEKAGFKNGFEFTLCYSDREVYRRAAEFIKRVLSELNINVITKEFGWKELLEKSKGEGVDSIIIGWGADTPDPDSFIFPLFHSSQRTHTRFKNKEIDELIEKARRERNISKRKEIYKIIEERVLEEAPCVFLYHPLITSLRNEKIFGIVPHPIGSAEIIYAVKDD
ncbi:MAG: ABC transporter substrate-binding protein, partial [candidate division WOR-3 bacterium]